MNTRIRSIATLVLILAFAALFACLCTGCTYASGKGFTYVNLGFEKSLAKAEVKPDGSVSIEGVKNATPQIIEAAVGAAVKAAK